ncbi:MAG: hypothetical protein J6B86_02540 [Clostridia bacterium]|nr:hypothetical protein [Clostridia bacterium]
MKKRIFSLFLCVLISLSFVACGGTSPADDSVQTDSDKTSVNVSTKTDKNTDTNDGDTDEKEEEIPGYDPTMEHKFIACDIISHGIVVFDLNACDGDFQRLTDDDVAVVWEWDPEEDPNLKTKGPNLGIDSAKYRYSSYYEKDVMIACSSNGWVGIIDYEAKTLLWETTVSGGPHSVEMLPNGDLVVGCSSKPGALVYYAISAGYNKKVHSIPSLYCHGVSWDPEEECLWVLEHTGVYAAVIENMGTKNGKIIRIDRSGAQFPKNYTGGHAFSPVAGQPGRYWASSGGDLWQFDANDEKMYSNYPMNLYLSRGSIKGVTSFADGTVIETIGGIGNNSQSWSSAGFLIVTRDRETQEVKSEYVLFDHRDFYKIQPFTKDYQ